LKGPGIGGLIANHINSGLLDNEAEVVVVDLCVGDAIVVPAGVAHCSLESEDGYEYVGLYPILSYLFYDLFFLILQIFEANLRKRSIRDRGTRL
jgi:hypothetical protein